MAFSRVTNAHGPHPHLLTMNVFHKTCDNKINEKEDGNRGYRKKLLRLIILKARRLQVPICGELRLIPLQRSLSLLITLP